MLDCIAVAPATLAPGVLAPHIVARDPVAGAIVVGVVTALVVGFAIGIAVPFPVLSFTLVVPPIVAMTGVDTETAVPAGVPPIATLVAESLAITCAGKLASISGLDDAGTLIVAVCNALTPIAGLEDDPNSGLVDGRGVRGGGNPILGLVAVPFAPSLLWWAPAPPDPFPVPLPDLSAG